MERSQIFRQDKISLLLIYHNKQQKVDFHRERCNISKTKKCSIFKTKNEQDRQQQRKYLLDLKKIESLNIDRSVGQSIQL
jgi:hypothetical protein